MNAKQTFDHLRKLARAKRDQDIQFAKSAYSDRLEQIKHLERDLSCVNPTRASRPRRTVNPTKDVIDAVAYIRDGEKLSLNMIPDTKYSNGDAILMIIYGYQKLVGLDGVSSPSIMDSAKQSGLRIDRVSRSLTSEQSKYVLMGGSGKGARYTLNNRGMQYVEQLLGGMFD